MNKCRTDLHKINRFRPCTKSEQLSRILVFVYFELRPKSVTLPNIDLRSHVPLGQISFRPFSVVLAMFINISAEAYDNSRKDCPRKVSYISPFLLVAPNTKVQNVSCLVTVRKWRLQYFPNKRSIFVNVEMSQLTQSSTLKLIQKIDLFINPCLILPTHVDIFYCLTVALKEL